ncbi:rhamnan synthesis F family protein [Kaistia adipata]|uniref:rhamnan synthesis F family protein n=1 Tax=Kaistia adipata TaxID=166954 RepID=UPI000684C29D|nr:rhamnan synthesis F family protein [Kaistia adipata]
MTLFTVRKDTGRPEILIHAPGRYIIELQRRDRAIPFVRLAVQLRPHPDRVIYLPATEQTRYLLETTESGLVLQFDDHSVVACSVRLLSIRDLGSLLRQRRRQKRWMQPLIHLPMGGEVVLRPLLHAGGPKERELALALRGLSGWGLGPATASLQQVLARHFEGPPPAEAARPPLAPLRVGIVIHLYYQELWSEFEALLSRLERPFRLILTLTGPARDLHGHIRRTYPDAETIIYENRGRDIGPFIQLLMDGRLDDFDLICKLHGKKSALDGPRAALGEIWRLASLYDLIGNRDAVDRIIDVFARSPGVGMIGSDRFRLPNEWKGEKAAWGTNETKTRDLLTMMGITPIPPIDFFAGTMFWVRREALEPLKKLDLALDSFPDEAGQEDGTLQHALERAMAMMIPNKIGV